jgi:hypothetical protein
MPPVPLGINAYKRSDGFSPEVRCVNMYVEEDKSGASPDSLMRIQRSGLNPFVTLAGQVRGLFQQDGVLDSAAFAVAGDTFQSFDDIGGTAIGTVAEGERVPFAANFEKLFLLSGGIAYQYGSIPFAAIVMPDDRPVVDIDTINNYLILACADGRFYWMVPGSDVVDPLDFATAESSPDGLVSVRRLVDELWFQGGNSGEVWQPTGDSDAPFLRAGGRTIDQGCLYRDTSLRFDNSLVWVNNQGKVVRAAQTPQVISDAGIEERIEKRSGALSALILKFVGHEMYVLKIPGQGSFAFDAVTSQWCEFASEDETEWRPHVGPEFASRAYLGDEESGKVWLFDPLVNTDDGEPFLRLVTGNVPLMGLPGKQSSFSVGVGASADTVCRVRWKDGQDDFPAMYDELEVRAPYDICSMYRLGQPEQPVRSFEVSFTEDVRIRISGARANEAWH